MTETELQGNATVSSSLPVDDFLWLLRKCKELNTNRSALIAKIVSEAREREEAPCASTPER